MDGSVCSHSVLSLTLKKDTQSSLITLSVSCLSGPEAGCKDKDKRARRDAERQRHLEGYIYVYEVLLLTVYPVHCFKVSSTPSFLQPLPRLMCLTGAKLLFIREVLKTNYGITTSNIQSFLQSWAKLQRKQMCIKCVNLMVFT